MTTNRNLTISPWTMRIAGALILALAMPLAACAADGAVEVLAVGSPAPDFQLADLADKQHKLSDYKGKVVVLQWINPECPFSDRVARERVMTETLAKHPGTVWLAINSTATSHPNYLEPAEHKTYNEKNGITYPVLYDPSGATGHAYGAKTTPHMFVIDEQGKVIYNGAIDDDQGGRKDKGERQNYVDGALTAHAKGQAPSPAVTKPWGCSVKYG